MYIVGPSCNESSVIEFGKLTAGKFNMANPTVLLQNDLTSSIPIAKHIADVKYKVFDLQQGEQ